MYLWIGAVGLCTACGSPATEGSDPKALPVQVACPVVREVTLTRDYPGYLESETFVDLVGRVNGTLQRKCFMPGGRVHRGQLLFVIEPTLYEDEVRQAEAALKTARAQADYAASSYARMQEAVKSEAVSRIQCLEAESRVAETQAAVSRAEAALETARTRLSYCYVKAPCDGLIDRCPYAVGTYIGGGTQPVRLATVYQDRRMYAYFEVSDNQYLTFLLNQAASSKIPAAAHHVTLQVGNEGQRTWEGKLDYLSPEVTTSTGTLSLRAVLENPEGVLRPGQYVRVNLPYAQVSKAILVPDASIGTDQLGRYLYVLNDSNVVQYRPVKVGELTPDGYRIISSGLLPTERYVTQALLKVRQGLQVQPEPVTPAVPADVVSLLPASGTPSVSSTASETPAAAFPISFGMSDTTSVSGTPAVVEKNLPVSTSK